MVHGIVPPYLLTRIARLDEPRFQHAAAAAAATLDHDRPLRAARLTLTIDAEHNLVAELEPNARFVKVDVDANPGLAAQFGVQGIPALFAFQGRKVAARQAGVTDAATLRSWVQRLAPGQVRA